MVSKKILKFIKSLQIKKYRKQEQSFLIEGAKSVLELIHSDIAVTTMLVTPKFLNDHDNLLNKRDVELIEVNESTLASIGSLKTNNAALAVAKVRQNVLLSPGDDEFALLLDDIRDPGNLGAIIRIADWYGIRKIICSETCADFYNPKVVMASMGSFTRVHAYYTNLPSYLRNTNIELFGALLNGENVHEVNFGRNGLILMGNESKGINEMLLPYINKSISIPKFGGAESLNVAVATAVICDNLRR